MGLDMGSHTIGLAISDESGLIAQSLETIKRRSVDEDFKEISRVIDQFKIEKIVVGLPKNMNGTLGKQAEMVLQWIEALKKRKKVIDRLAAALILQGFLDQDRNLKDESPSPQ